MVTLDGETKWATLFVRYRTAGGELRLRKDRVLTSGGQPFQAACIRVVDWDRDGLKDLVIRTDWHACGGVLQLLRNVGTQKDPQFEAGRRLCCFGEPIVVGMHGPCPWVGDFDGDSKADPLACTELSFYPFFSHVAIEMKVRPTYTLGSVAPR
jgi:hypothetical protein